MSKKCSVITFAPIPIPDYIEKQALTKVASCQVVRENGTILGNIFEYPTYDIRKYQRVYRWRTSTSLALFTGMILGQSSSQALKEKVRQRLQPAGDQPAEQEGGFV